MQNQIDDIIVWQRKTFPDTTVNGTLRHLAQEVIEFCIAYNHAIAPTSLIRDRLKYETNKLLEICQEKATKEIDSNKIRDVKGEIADMQILLIQLADTCGVRLSDVLDEKMKENNIRRWSVDENEIAQHIEDVCQCDEYQKNRGHKESCAYAIPRL